MEQTPQNWINKPPAPLPPTDDWIAKQLFIPKENQPLLVDFLQSYLNLPASEYEGLEIIDPHLHKQADDDKLGILDLRAKTKTGMQIDVEMQAKKDPYMMERILAYMSKIMYSQLESGEDYGRIHKVNGVFILGFDLLPTNQYHSISRITDTVSGFTWNNLWEAHVIELKKMPKEDTRSAKTKWLQFFNIRTWEDLEMAAKIDPIMELASERLLEFSMDPDTRRIYEQRLKTKRVIAGQIRYAAEQAEEKGKLEGKLEGKQEAFRQIVQFMVSNNKSIDEIAESTGLNSTEVEEIVKSL